MKIKERLLYQKNKEGFLLMLGFIILNTVYSIFTLNTMDKNYYLGSFIMQTIMLLLFGFLIAVKIKDYSLSWSIVAIIIGVFQFSRLFFVETLAEGSKLIILNSILIGSAVFCLAGGVISYYSTLQRKKLKGELHHG